ncbi:signal recognition particle subunit SRP19/SEC65 family protein [Candidatus Bathyarchaeota archaeon]|nr:signal recognition particle subunit SRP19/SEC65 family protein [Candidatus Bathyarchaeota archaeon]
MRKQEKIIVWPVYFDSTRTRGAGRRVSKGLAVSYPKILEIRKAVEELGLDYELLLDAGYPKTPWLKTGMLLMAKNKSKSKTIKKIAKQLLKVRSAAAKK